MIVSTNYGLSLVTDQSLPPSHRHTLNAAPLLSQTASPTPLLHSRMMEDRCAVNGLHDNKSTDSTAANGVLAAQQGPLECVIL